MERFLIIFFVFVTQSLLGQIFDKQIQEASDSLSKRVISSGKMRVALGEFENLDGSKTQLCTFLANEISGELANKTENQTKFKVLERANLDLIFEEKKLVKSAKPNLFAKQLGDLDTADILIYGIITDFEGFYRVNVKLLDTKHGEMFSSYKISFIKTPSLEKLYQIPNGKPESKTPQTSNSSSSSTPNTTTTAVLDKGDICFNNQMDWCVVEIKVLDMNGAKVGNTSVRGRQTSCVYNLPVGVYKVEINSCGSGYNSRQVTTEQVKVEKDTSKEINIRQ